MAAAVRKRKMKRNANVVVVLAHAAVSPEPRTAEVVSSMMGKQSCEDFTKWLLETNDHQEPRGHIV